MSNGNKTPIGGKKALSNMLRIPQNLLYFDATETTDGTISSIECILRDFIISDDSLYGDDLVALMTIQFVNISETDKNIIFHQAKSNYGIALPFEVNNGNTPDEKIFIIGNSVQTNKEIPITINESKNRYIFLFSEYRESFVVPYKKDIFCTFAFRISKSESDIYIPLWFKTNESNEMGEFLLQPGVEV